MAVKTQKYLGAMKNRELVRDTVVGGVAKGVSITAGQLCFYGSGDPAGWKPTNAAVLRRGKVRIAENDASNTADEYTDPDAGVKKGDKVVTTWGGGIIAVVKVGELTKSSNEVAFAAGDPFINAASGTITSVLQPSTAPTPDDYLGVVLGKINEVDEHDVEAYGKQLATNDLVYVRMY